MQIVFGYSKRGGSIIITALDIYQYHCSCTDLSGEMRGDFMSSAAADILNRADQIIGIRPLQPTIGAEIEGIDLSKPLSSEQRDAIRAAVIQYKVVFFRDQPLIPRGAGSDSRLRFPRG
ncbi:TauD/TfdA dioxygenase family protein [Sphingobium aromaticiconvertens]|uniref:TauD/TfdA dioxygenase family protein n=1 Tax=Sphingobium aromaticiconvertens TaxID=365341 RepID=UPI00301B2147